MQTIPKPQEQQANGAGAHQTPTNQKLVNAPNTTHSKVTDKPTKNMDLTLLVWRQMDAKNKGKMVEYKAHNISPDMSFLEMLDVVNRRFDQVEPGTRLPSSTIVARASAARAD